MNDDIETMPGLEKFHADHREMCEICRGLEEALVEAHARLSDRVAENERLRGKNDQLQREVERRESGVYGKMRDELGDENERLRGWLVRLEDAPNPYAIQDILDEYRNALAEEVSAEDISPR